MSEDPARYWNGEKWFTVEEMENALNEARLAIDEYYNGDRLEAEYWLLTAYEANQARAAKRRQKEEPVDASNIHLQRRT